MLKPVAASKIPRTPPRRAICGKTARPIPNRGLHEVLLPVTDCSWSATIAARVHFFCQPELRGQLMAERYID